ncbi:hypothetical protein GGH91_001062 [Coemansia sp. RSA 2671]|nr:hypothetical protein GGH91_001062 [Coemansia sp. RSA 2671]
MFGILDSLQKKVEPRRDTTTTAAISGSRPHREMPRLVLQTSNPIVDLQQYRAKCNELEELASRFRAKCLDYDRLSSRYDQLRSGLNEQRMQQLKKTSSAAALARKPGTPLTNRDPFIELNAPEQTTKGIPARHGPKRTSPTEQVSPDNARVGSGAVEGTTPTKRPRHSTLTTSLPGILSSPLTSHKPHFPLNPRKRVPVPTTSSRPALRGPMSSPSLARTSSRGIGAAPNASAAAAKAPTLPIVLQSSQETRLDFSDPPYMPEDEGVLLCLGTHPEEGESEHRDEDAADDSAWQLMLQTPTRPERQYPEFPRDSSDSDSGGRKSESGSVCAQPSPDLQRILDAVGDCELCRSFYSVPGLVLPKRDPTTLCQHASGSRKSRGKAAADWGARNACNDGAMPHEGMAAPPLRHYRDATMSAPRPERGSTSSCQLGPVRQPPKSEQRRPTTPDHFWDIDYFPPINALGVDTFRRNKHQNSDSS